MPIDPRSLKATGVTANCHLIPDCLNVSSITVPLDETIDKRIGSICDSQLQRLFHAYVGTELGGRALFEGGSQTLKSVLSLSPFRLRIPLPSRSSWSGFETKGLGMREGHVIFQKFETAVVDQLAALTSILHSAFLVLYEQGHRCVFEPFFDPVRQLFSRAMSEKWGKSDWEFVNPLIDLWFAFPPNRVAGRSIGINDLRNVYDPTFDCGDEIYSEFPSRSVVQLHPFPKVILPYSRSIRAIVSFDF
jgi:hypothetical protein